MEQQHDWEAIKRDYCAGVLSLQKVADRHSIAKTTLRDMAKKRHWERQTAPPNGSVQRENGRMGGRKRGRTVGASDGGACNDATAPEKCAKTPKTKRNSWAVGVETPTRRTSFRPRITPL